MKNNFFFPLLVGLAAGAVIGVLFAPAKGEESRAKLKKAFADKLGKTEDDTQKPEDDE